MINIPLKMVQYKDVTENEQKESSLCPNNFFFGQTDLHFSLINLKSSAQLFLLKSTEMSTVKKSKHKKDLMCLSINRQNNPTTYTINHQIYTIKHRSQFVHFFFQNCFIYSHFFSKQSFFYSFLY